MPLRERERVHVLVVCRPDRCGASVYVDAEGNWHNVDGSLHTCLDSPSLEASRAERLQNCAIDCPWGCGARVFLGIGGGWYYLNGSLHSHPQGAASVPVPENPYLVPQDRRHLLNGDWAAQAGNVNPHDDAPPFAQQGTEPAPWEADDAPQAPQDAPQRGAGLDWVVVCPCGVLHRVETPVGALSCDACGARTPMSTLEAFRRGREQTPGWNSTPAAALLVGGAAEFAMWLDGEMGRVEDWNNEEVDGSILVRTWAAERAFTFEGDLIPRIMGDVRTAAVRTPVGVSEILHAMRQIREAALDPPTEDEARLLFLLEVYETRQYQERTRGRDGRPEQNEVWWADFISLYADKALDSGRQNGAWSQRMTDVAALALAAVEWRHQRDANVAVDVLPVAPVVPYSARLRTARDRPEAAADAEGTPFESAPSGACVRCGGRGTDPRPIGTTACDRCGGGRVEPGTCDPPEPCVDCGGTGQVDTYGPCWDCLGTGAVGVGADAFNAWESTFLSLRDDGEADLYGGALGGGRTPYQDMARRDADIGNGVLAVHREDGTLEVLGNVSGASLRAEAPVSARTPRSECLTANEEEVMRALASQLAISQGCSAEEARAALNTVIDNTGYEVGSHNAEVLLHFGGDAEFLRTVCTRQGETDWADDRMCPDCSETLTDMGNGVHNCYNCGYSECG